MQIVELPLNQLSLDSKAQPRVKLDKEVIGEYADLLREGASFPPVVVFADGSNYWLADGFHRCGAHRHIGAVTIEAEVREGTLKDAILFSVSANATHGLRRSPEDKRRAVRTLLENEEWGCWSENEIAKKCGVSRRLVTAVKKDLEAEGRLVQAQDDVVIFTRGDKTHQMKTERIGSKREIVSDAAVVTAASEAAVMTPLAENAIARLEALFASFAILPTTERMASLVEECEVSRIKNKASEVSAWFRALEQHLDAGSSKISRRPRSSFPSYHSVIEVQK